MADTRPQSPSKSSLTRQAGVVVSVAEEEAVAVAAEAVEPLAKTEEGAAFPKGESALAEPREEEEEEERNRRHRRCLTNTIFQALAGPSPTNKTDKMATIVCA